MIKTYLVKENDVNKSFKRLSEAKKAAIHLYEPKIVVIGGMHFGKRYNYVLRYKDGIWRKQ